MYTHNLSVSLSLSLSLCICICIYMYICIYIYGIVVPSDCDGLHRHIYILQEHRLERVVLLTGRAVAAAGPELLVRPICI